MLSIEVCIDVPDMERGIRFYGEALGFAKVAAPYPGVAVLKHDAATVTLLEKRDQTQPFPNTREVRRYDRHWTPVHLDFHVEDVKATLGKILAAGATQEQFFETPGHGAIAFCADPFGNGFCLLQRQPK